VSADLPTGIQPAWRTPLWWGLLAAGFFMVRGGRHEPQKAHRMAHALTWRIGLSVVLFLCLLLAHALGWIQPTGILYGA